MIPMLARFSGYGFLKNQTYFEPFLILAFREKGLSFFEIGLLIAFREICINLMEIPSGAIADIYGRKNSMIFSFIAYIFSFMAFAFATEVWILLPAMFLFAIGEAFRSGTHKAIIFEWLRQQQRLSEKTKIYGFTRSWSKIGSALSVLIGVALVFYSGNYSSVFLFAIPPYLLNIVNFFGYPSHLDLKSKNPPSIKAGFVHLWESLLSIRYSAALKRIYAESMGFEVSYDTAKSYLQPLLKHAALAAPILTSLDGHRKTAVLIGCVYFLLELASSWASRKSHELSSWAGGELQVSTVLWKGQLLGFALLSFTILFKLWILAGLSLILLSVLQNLWRPALMCRIDDHSSAEKGATMLSIEAQLKSFAIMVVAPSMGYLVDHYGFWPIGFLGLALSTAAILFKAPTAIQDK